MGKKQEGQKEERLHLSGENEILSLIEKKSGQKINTCYQCGKCSAGCPVGYAMDLTPRQILRALQLGIQDEVLQSSSIWYCVNCQICSLRCPKEIDIARIMESLRWLAWSKTEKSGLPRVTLFYHSFLTQIRWLGRIHEMGLGALYNFRLRRFFENLSRLPTLLLKRKLKIFPSLKGYKAARKLSRRVKKLKEKNPW